MEKREENCIKDLITDDRVFWAVLLDNRVGQGWALVSFIKLQSKNIKNIFVMRWFFPPPKIRDLIIYHSAETIVRDEN